MKCVKVGNIPDDKCFVGTCPECSSEWEISKSEIWTSTAGTCRLCYMGVVKFTPKLPAVEKGYVCVSQKNGPDRHYFNDEEIKIGIYRIHWGDSKTPTSSLAAIACGPDGMLWVTVTNWVSITRIDALFTDHEIARMEYLSEKIRNI